MERIWNFKLFVDGKPETVPAEKIATEHDAWDFIEIGASMDKAPAAVLKALNSASMQVEKKLISQDEYQQVLRDVAESAEMLEQLIGLKSLLIDNGYAVTGQTQISFSESKGTPWLNARLYRVPKLTAEEANAAKAAVLFKKR